MRQLRFKPCFHSAILDGNKRTTIRRWSKARLASGQKVFAPRIGWLRIQKVESIELGRLTDADARSDGLADLDQLLRTLSRIYPGHGEDGKHWFRIHFRPVAKSKTRKLRRTNGI